MLQPRTGTPELPVRETKGPGLSELGAVLAANRRYAKSFVTSHLPAPPSRRLVVLTCMDARIDPLKVLGLTEGEAHVLRNAGGRASDDAIRSLVISTHLLKTREILVIHHTDCGLLNVTNAQVRDRLRNEAGVETAAIDFLPIANLDESVREDVARLRASPLLPAVTVHGFVYDVRSGRLRAIDLDDQTSGPRVDPDFEVAAGDPSSD